MDWTKYLVGGPTEVTSICKAYHEGRIDWPETKRRLIAFDWKDQPPVSHLDRYSGDLFGDEHGGTVDELWACVHNGWLTRPQAIEALTANTEPA